MGKTIVYKGITYPSLRKFCQLNKLRYSTILYRMQDNMSLEEAVEWSTVKDPITGQVYRNITEMIRAYGINSATFYSRMRNNWDIKDALTVKPGVFKNYAKESK